MPQHLRKWTARIAKTAAVLVGMAMLTGFETPARVDAATIKPLPRSFVIRVVEGSMTPAEADFRRSGDTYVNEAPAATGSNLMAASWFAVHPTDSDAVVLEYPSKDSAGQTIYRLEYALEEARNRYRLFRLDQDRFVAALDALESSVRRDDATFKERKFYEDLTRIWNTHASRAGERRGEFFIAGIEDLNTLIAYSRRLGEGQKIITSTGDVVEVYVN